MKPLSSTAFNGSFSQVVHVRHTTAHQASELFLSFLYFLILSPFGLDLLNLVLLREIGRGEAAIEFMSVGPNICVSLL